MPSGSEPDLGIPGLLEEGEHGLIYTFALSLLVPCVTQGKSIQARLHVDWAIFIPSSPGGARQRCRMVETPTGGTPLLAAFAHGPGMVTPHFVFAATLTRGKRSVSTPGIPVMILAV